MEILRKFRHAILKSEVTPLGCGSREDLQRIHGIGGRLESQSDRRQFRGAALAIRGIIPGSIMAKSKARPSEWLAETETNRRATYIIFTPKSNRGENLKARIMSDNTRQQQMTLRVNLQLIIYTKAFLIIQSEAAMQLLRLGISPINCQRASDKVINQRGQ